MVAKIAMVISVVALLLALASILLSNTNLQSKIASLTNIAQNQTTKTLQTPTVSLPVFNSNVISMYAPAVDNEGNGIATTLTVQAIPGRGRILTNINNLLFWTDTQQSIQTAVAVAQNISKVDTSKIDLIYSIDTNATVIEGPSAGAALTIATIAALENKPLNQSVMITGTINPDGTIGPVGGIVAKAGAAKDVGAKLFLVPEGQGIQTTYTPKQTCQQYNSFTFCTTEYVKQTVDTTKSVGIDVREVSTIRDALNYLLVK